MFSSPSPRHGGRTLAAASSMKRYIGALAASSIRPVEMDEGDCNLLQQCTPLCLRVFVLHPEVTPLGNDPEWFKVTRFYPEMCLSGCIPSLFFSFFFPFRL